MKITNAIWGRKILKIATERRQKEAERVAFQRKTPFEGKKKIQDIVQSIVLDHGCYGLSGLKTIQLFSNCIQILKKALELVARLNNRRSSTTNLQITYSSSNAQHKQQAAKLTIFKKKKVIPVSKTLFHSFHFTHHPQQHASLSWR